MKGNQKSVRLTDKVCGYIEKYRGDSFSEKLENLVLDYEERRNQLTKTWDLLQGQITDKQAEMRRVQDRLRKTREVDARLGPLVDAVVGLLGCE